MSHGIQIKKIFKIKKYLLFFCLFFIFLEKPVNADTVLGALNKVSGKISKLTFKDNKETFFGTLKIVVRTCNKSLPEDPPENSAFIQVWDIKFDKEEKRVFSGWMFSSSPSISALEHAVYDVWVIECKVSYIDD